MAAGAASTFGLPLRPALALSHFRTPHEAPLIGQDTSRISEVLETGISVPQDSKNLMLMNENIFVVPAGACHRAGEAGPVGRDNDGDWPELRSVVGLLA